MSVQTTVIVTGVLTDVVAAVSGQVGRPSGAQSGLPSNIPAVLVKSMGMPDASEFLMKTSPLPAKSSVYAIRDPFGDQVQL